MYDVAIVGGGVAGMATAARLQAGGFSTIVLESHSLPGGCAGFYRRKGFSFDVGATTLVDFQSGGVGGQFLEEIGLDDLACEHLPGYMAWLPDWRLTLSRDPEAWDDERLRVLGSGASHRRFWKLIDRLSAVFWRAARNGIRLPIRRPQDALRAARCVGPAGLLLGRYLHWTMGDLLRGLGLRHERPLTALLSMLIEDTVHGALDSAPLINASLGVSIRGAGLSRARGGMRGFWSAVAARYRTLGGELRTRCAIEQVEQSADGFLLHTTGGSLRARQVVSSIPAHATRRIAPPGVVRCLEPYVQRDANALGGAILVCLGVPDSQVTCQPLTHHQLMHDYERPLGNGNNMFISVSSPHDLESAPEGFRSVMISTHCDLSEWESLSAAEYEERKECMGERLIALARRVYPDLARPAAVREIATPRTYERFTGRPRGAVGGVRQTLLNSNQHAIPHRTPLPGFWLAGDTTWPGLGTVACLLSSRIVAEGVQSQARKLRRHRVGFPAQSTAPTVEVAHA